MTKLEFLQATIDADDDAEIKVYAPYDDISAMEITDVTISDDGSKITIEVE